MIRTRSLHWAYPDGPRLEFPDLDLEQGGALLLQGRSGSGKSTWLALVAGLRTGGGELEVAGQPLALLAPAERDAWRGRTIGFLPQRLHLSESLTVAQNLRLAYFAAGVAAREGDIGAALASLGVAALADRRPSQLSGGQAQRVALARAVLMKPRVILADEPTASLDDEACADALALLRATATRCAATLVVATHDRRVRQAWPDAPALQLGAVAA